MRCRCGGALCVMRRNDNGHRNILATELKWLYYRSRLLGECMVSNAFVESVETQAAISPQAIAFEADSCCMTYGELSSASNAIAAKLREMTSDRFPVVVFGHKDFRMVASFLGCLKSCHAFVPVDVELPASRIGDILSQLDSPFVVCAAPLSGALAPYVATDRVLDISGFSDPAALIDAFSGCDAPASDIWVSGEETQYIIFTSGSTGKPKGIEISANNVCNFMQWVRTFPVVREGGQVFLDQPPYSFDLSEYELVGALSTGGRMHAVSHELTADTRSLFADLAKSDVSVWVSTPSFADLCLVDPSFSESMLPSVKLFLFCGEALRHATAAALRERFPHAIVANTYGPTESTVAVTYCEIGEAELASDAPLPAGAPRPGTEIRICDPETGESCATGDSGEIVIVGDTVAKGYYRNPEKTQKAFSQSSLCDGTQVRAYRTGDAGHVDEQGVLHCEGRFDSLIKLHGFRIELEDVEENIRALRGVKQACVVPVVHKESIAYLKAFIVLQKHPDGTPAYEELESDAADCAACCDNGEGKVEVPSKLDLERSLKASLAARIPEYMVPRRFALIDEMRLTPNGKIDRKALAASSRSKRA